MAYRICLVDDDQFLTDLYAVKFKNAGQEVTTFSDGKAVLSALENADTPKPDALLIDIVMPDLNGFDIVKEIRDKHLAPDMRIIFLSNQGQPEDIQNAKELNADGYIVKATAVPSEVYEETVRIIETPRTAA